MKQLKDYTLEELQENFVVIINIECGHELGFMKQKDADDVFGEYDESFPLCYEPLISDERKDMIIENKTVSKNKLKEIIYEEFR